MMCWMLNACLCCCLLNAIGWASTALVNGFIVLKEHRYTHHTAQGPLLGLHPDFCNAESIGGEVMQPLQLTLTTSV